MTLEQDDIEYGRSKANNTFFKKSSLLPRTSTQVKIVDVEKLPNAKYPIAGETWCYRFLLEDGRVWDESTTSLFGKIVKILHPDGKTLQATTVKLTKLVSKPAKGSQYTVEEVKTT